MSRMVAFTIVLAGAVIIAECSVGATLTVRRDGTGDFGVIQDALDLAADGDTILIGPGEYLEETVFRPPGFSYDLRTYGQVKSDGLTIIGSGVGQTVIGPSTYEHDGAQFNPKGFAYTSGWGDLRILNVRIQNCNSGIWMKGTLYMDNCELRENAIGVFWETVGLDGWVKNTEIQGVNDLGVLSESIHLLGLGSDILIENCRFDNAKTVIKSIHDVNFVSCSISNDVVGISVDADSYILVSNCEITNISVGVNLFGVGGTCEIRDSVISGEWRALQTNPGGRFLIENSVLIGGVTAVIYATQNPGPCVVNNCDFVKGDGPIVLCDNTTTPVTHDLTNNYWGTTEASDIEEWIVDINDDPGVLATVLFEPFSTDPLPVEEGQKSFGGVKAMFR